MKFSDKTISILKNFSTINKCFVFRKGKRQRIMSPFAEIFAEAIIEEDIPTDVGISDLSKFLSVLSLYKEYDIEFQDKNFLIKSLDGKNSTKYFYDEIKNLKGIPDGNAKIKFPEEFLEFKISKNVYNNVIKAANTLQLEDLCFRAEEGKLHFQALKSNVSDNNIHTVEIGKCEEKFKLVMSMQHMKLLDLDYNVQITKNNKVKFLTEDNTLYYIVAITEKSSTRG